MDLGIKDRVAIVAASSRGLGKAVAMGLAQEGVNLVICSRGEDVLAETASEILSETGVWVKPVAADVSKKDEIDKVVDHCIKEYGTVDIMVNNAGGPPLGEFIEFDDGNWEQALELNLFSTIRFTRAVLPHMREKNWGRIVNITSVAVKQPIDGLILSNTARTAVIGLAKTLSNENGEHNILINNVCPGRIFTDRIKQLAEARAERDNKTFDEVIESMKTDIPLGRIGDPEEFANMVVFLCSERASYITGATIQIDGGLVTGLF